MSDSEIPQKLTAEGLKAKLNKWLYLTDPQALDIVLGTAVAIYLPGDPLWTLLVGPSGGGKTEFLSMFADADDVVMLSKMTRHTLLSGLKRAPKGTDLIYTLNDKLLVIKDLAPILELGGDDQREILADLRDAYDGLVVKSWGSGKKTARWEGNFGLLAAATPAIDRHWKFFAELGERYVRINLHTKPEEQARAALARMGEEREMRKELREAGSGLLAYYKDVAHRVAPSSDMTIRNLVADLAHVTGVLRTPVIRDRQHNIQAMPEPEVGTRLAKQFLKLAQAAALLYGKDEPGDEEYDLVLRAANDAIPVRRAKVLEALFDGKTTLTDISTCTSIPYQTAKIEIEDLALLRVVRKDSGDKAWKLDADFAAKLEDVGLAETFTREVPPIAA